MRVTAVRLPPTQTLARIVECNHFQDAEAFLKTGDSAAASARSCAKASLRINSALFVVITEDRVFRGSDSRQTGREVQRLAGAT